MDVSASTREDMELALAQVAVEEGEHSGGPYPLVPWPSIFSGTRTLVPGPCV